MKGALAALDPWAHGSVVSEFGCGCVDTEEPASPTTARRQAWGEVDADMMHRTPCFGGRTQLYSVAFADMFTLFRFKVVYSRVVPIFVQIMETSRHLL